MQQKVFSLDPAGLLERSGSSYLDLGVKFHVLGVLFSLGSPPTHYRSMIKSPTVPSHELNRPGVEQVGI